MTSIRNALHAIDNFGAISCFQTLDNYLADYLCSQTEKHQLGKTNIYLGLPWWLSSKESACDARDLGSIPGSGRSPGEGNGNPLQ